MSIFDDAKREHADRQEPPASDDTAKESAPTRGRVRGSVAASTPLDERRATVTIDGEPVPVDRPETTQTDDESTWLTGTRYGRPRGRDAIEARRVSQTAAMEAITNGIVDQIIGGELVFDSDDEDVEDAEADLQALLQDVLEGPHPMGNDLDDLLTAAIADMMGPGNAYWQLLPSANGDLPVAALIPLDALTIRHNVDRHGFPPEGESPYWQATNAFSSEGLASMGDITPVPLDYEDLAVMHYPRGKRPYQIYPKSPSLQVLEWLEILVNSTTHHNRFYNDNEVPPGFIQVMNATDRTIADIQDKIQAASADPRSVEVIGGEGQAMWVEMGGTAINLDVIQEQQWFFQMCLGSLGLGKAELGFIEDANRSNGEVEQTRVYKRIAGPFSKQFHNAFRHISGQYDAYNALDRPFTPRLEFADPSAERARQERLRQQYQSGLITYNDFLEARGINPADVDTTVELDGALIDYGEHPQFVVEHLLRGARADTPEDAAEDAAEGDGDEEQALRVGDGAGGHPTTNGDGQH